MWPFARKPAFPRHQPPPLLRQLINERRWRHPGDDMLLRAIPFLDRPVHFYLTLDAMWHASRGEFADDPQMSLLFHEYRGQRRDATPLTWLDADMMLMLAVNREIGDDVGIALDFRTGFDDPRVVASDWQTDDHTHHWREAFRCFSDFVEAIRL